MFIVGLDIATSCGGADGRPGSKPRCFTWDMRKAEEGRPARLAMLMAYAVRYFAENKVDAVYYEAGMRMQAALEIGTNDETFALLRGAIGVIEACAYRARVPIISAVSVQEARKHFVGQKSFPKGRGKAMVMERCKLLRWEPENLDESDAAAIWDYGCARSNPRTAHISTELFGRRF